MFYCAATSKEPHSQMLLIEKAQCSNVKGECKFGILLVKKLTTLFCTCVMADFLWSGEVFSFLQRTSKFGAEAEHSYFFGDFSLKIFLRCSWITWYDFNKSLRTYQVLCHKDVAPTKLKFEHRGSLRAKKKKKKKDRAKQRSQLTLSLAVISILLRFW